ncbi:antibiotic biosynthesis monooxygenase family protein [Pseudofrankia sp. BMG5.36]|uniref:putative quinol monooxygenase n=1 Tax=Pseudofrankia sp. BMG5.36 TaxID=1834512 RepID=UPI001F520A67|nr:antibiotic biosynthesis monooxygenase family protein [Pseudofrankia sp. BMG5.36]
MTFVVVAHYRAAPGTERRVAESLRQMVEPRRQEPGNRAYNVCRPPADPTVLAI